VVLSGMQTAQLLLGNATIGDFLQAPPQTPGSP
jgi:hypothetical protein